MYPHIIWLAFFKALSLDAIHLQKDTEYRTKKMEKIRKSRVRKTIIEVEKNKPKAKVNIIEPKKEEIKSLNRSPLHL
jgi:hypothetical protein